MTKEEYNEYYRTVRNMRKKCGICTICGKTEAREGKRTCQPCAEKNSQKALAYYYRKKAENAAGQGNISEA